MPKITIGRYFGIALYVMKHYSHDTQMKMADIMATEDGLVWADQAISKELTEEELLDMMKDIKMHTNLNL